MNWLKSIILDLIVTALLITAVTTDLSWARWVVIIYTPFMLLLKVLALVGQSLIEQFKPRSPEAPAWAFHLLYAVNVAALACAQWWITAAEWAVIWLLSYIEHRRLRRSA